MNIRKIKKQATRFMAGEKEFPISINWFITSTDGDGVYKVEYRIPFKVRREVDRLAYRRGWDGCHWSAPTLLGVLYPDGILEPPVGGWGEEKLPIAVKALAKGW